MINIFFLKTGRYLHGIEYSETANTQTQINSLDRWYIIFKCAF